MHHRTAAHWGMAVNPEIAGGLEVPKTPWQRIEEAAKVKEAGKGKTIVSSEKRSRGFDDQNVEKKQKSLQRHLTPQSSVWLPIFHCFISSCPGLLSRERTPPSEISFFFSAFYPCNSTNHNASPASPTFFFFSVLSSSFNSTNRNGAMRLQ